jgi:hypothetical protein
LTLTESNYRNLLLPGKALPRRYEGFADRIHQGAGGELVAARKSKETGHTLFALSSRNVHLQVHPVDTFPFQGDVIGQHFGHAW